MSGQRLLKTIYVFCVGLMMASSASADSGQILEGILDVPRLSQTAPIDGCAKVQKGLINNGGFLLFTCEKLRPEFPITQHQSTFLQYQALIRQSGWQAKSRNLNQVKYTRTDAFGCEAHLDMTLWKDRSMNEPRRAASDREAHRQILFMARFYGPACERYYSTAQALATARP